MSDRSEELNSELEDGFYRVKIPESWTGGGCWELARLYCGRFSLADGADEAYPASDFDDVGPRIPSPDEASQ